MGKNLQYSLVGNDGGANITVYRRGTAQPFIADESHPFWEEILSGVMADDPSVLDRFDIGLAVSKRFALSDRVSYSDGALFFDNDPVDNSLTEHIVRTYQANEDFAPLVALFERIQSNPSMNSRNQMYSFLRANQFTITKDGMVVGYKGVTTPVDRVYRSIHSGPALINGEPHSGGQVPQRVGDVIEMPRGQVADNPNEACSVGLHVATWGFASGFGHGAVLEVAIDPRDIVSVPNDHDAQKVRVCRYKVVGEVTGPYDTPIKPDEPIEAPEDSVTVGVTDPEYKQQPTFTQFAFAKLQARRQKRSIAAVCMAKEWQLVGDDPHLRENWHIA